jgi:flagellar biogenesis protein FliO
MLAFLGASALGDEKPPRLALSSPAERVPVAPRPRLGESTTEATGGWWFSTVGVAAALAVVGGVSLASKRLAPARDGGSIQVVGRSSLSARHAVYLLRVGERVLIVGAGPQGAPSTLGEVTDPAELTRLIPRRASRAVAEPVEPSRPSPLLASAPRFDRRIGDDE